MRFIDEAKITVQSGNGGRGCVSFRHEKFIEFGGPDGGDGGGGGDVVLKTAAGKRTLYQFRHQKQLSAGNGKPGEGSQRDGKRGNDIVLELPPGTTVSDAETGEILKDFTEAGETYVIAKGGRGGQGNRRFASARRQAPRFAQPGEPGETLVLNLELKLLADVGLVGFPSVGKSTLISVISSARPKIGAYPFTTLTPNLGMVQAAWGEPFAVADIPGLIEGAHTGVGLGIKFLRHVERTRFLVHLIDVSEINPEDPLEHYRAINRELALYSEKLAKKRQLVVINKMDLTDAEETADGFTAALEEATEGQGIEVLRISAATRTGIEELKSKLVTWVEQSDGE